MARRIDPETGYPAHGTRLTALRRRLTGWLTRSFRHATLSPGERLPDGVSIERVLVLRSNHRLGNQLLTTPLVREIHRRFPAARIDVLGRGGQVEPVYRNFDGVDRVLSIPRRPLEAPRDAWCFWRAFRSREYDLLFHADGASSTGRVLTRVCRARHRLENAPADRLAGDQDEAQHIAGNLVLSLRSHLPETTVPIDEPVPTLSMALSGDERARGRGALDAVRISDRPVICLYTFATGDKHYDATWWVPLRARLAEALPGFQLVEALPVENVSELGFELPTYYSRDIRALGAFIAACSLFVSGDCGIMHLASAAGTPTVGLFKASPPQQYRPYNPGSLAIDTRELDVEEAADRVIGHVRRLVDSWAARPSE